MIDLIYRSKAPAYKGAKSTTNSKPGLLSGFWCYPFGGGSAPAYRDASTNGATARRRPAAGGPSRERRSTRRRRSPR